MPKWLLQATAGIAALALLFQPAMPRAKKAELYHDQVAVLIYHLVDDEQRGPVTISPALLRDQLSFLKERGFHFITHRQFREFLDGGTVPNNAVLVTFDDGYDSYGAHAMPIMKELGVPAVNFVITETLDHPLQGNLRFLDRSGLAKTADETRGYEIQCHTHALHAKGPKGPLLATRLTDVRTGAEESDRDYENRIAQDALRCRREINSVVPASVDAIAYPFGAFDERSIPVLRDAGYRYGYTVVPEMADRSVDRMQIPRINAGSPYVSPRRLYNAILKSVYEIGDPDRLLPLDLVARDVGFEMHDDPRTNTVELVWNKRHYRLNGDARKVELADGQAAMEMSDKIEKRGKHVYIRKNDLQHMLGKRVEYMVNLRRYAVLQTPPQEGPEPQTGPTLAVQGGL
ncbi:polysaccharide deacetylase family protein [Paenibacillus thermoaerophilus]|uniref:Polysaccharide deacetylase family protein n=1 Tax=Paenibacillus thermoaerophilus TaxID=1215385 RepID=A0ABW2UYY4_9BACL|nr:polysaccharide deacetylase family protein [Paenibacillus thermoaerophilus]TMV15997.1 polysaccharide deacetylase family protein [Paenibacillus thermoaerophilus]